MHIYIERKDGKIARVEVHNGNFPLDDDRDIWGYLEMYWPKSYDHITEDMVLPSYVRWDDRFDLGEDAELRDWIMEGRE